MRMINLEKLKLEKTYNFGQKIIPVNEDGKELRWYTLKQLNDFADEIISNIKLESLTHYIFEINEYYRNVETEEPSDEEWDFMITASQIFINKFFEKITTEEKRNREQRLDVPEELKQTNISLSALKRAINNKTIIDKFNITIVMNDLIYQLISPEETKAYYMSDLNQPKEKQEEKELGE